MKSALPTNALNGGNMLSYNTYRPGGLWEYEMFTEVLTVTRYPEKKELALDQPNALFQLGKVRDYNSKLARLIDKAARNLLQRVSAQGWEPVDALDAESLWAKGRVRYEDGSGFRERAGDTREIGPTTVSIFCRRWINKEMSSDDQNWSTALTSPIQG
jgi:hypothetical protein